MTRSAPTPSPASARPRAFTASVFVHALGISGALVTAGSSGPEVRWAAAAESAMTARSALWAECLAPVESAPPPQPPAITEEVMPTSVCIEAVLPDPDLADLAALADEVAEPGAHTASELRDPPRAHAAPDWLAQVVAPRAAPMPNTEPAPTVAADAEASAFVRPSPAAGSNVPPRYPFVAWRRGFEGTVSVLLEIDERGAVTAAHVADSSGCGLLDDAALEALRGWRFAAAHRGGRPVRSTWRQTVVFRLSSQSALLPDAE